MVCICCPYSTAKPDSEKSLPAVRPAQDGTITTLTPRRKRKRKGMDG